MKFIELYNEYINCFLIEQINYDLLKKLNSDVELAKKQIKSLTQKKIKYKALSKQLILHLVNNNYDNIINNNLPDLKKIAGKISDDEFKDHLTQKLSTISQEEYNNFWNRINDMILKISGSHRELFDNLKNLRPHYIMSF